MDGYKESMERKMPNLRMAALFKLSYRDRKFDVEPYYDALNTGVIDLTVGISVSEELHQFWRDLQDTDDGDVDSAQSIHNHLENLAHRHPGVFERAMGKLKIDREM